MSTKNNDSDEITLETLLDSATNVKIYTCEDFKGNVEITKNGFMHLFYTRKLLTSSNIKGEPPIQSFDMDIESPTPGSDNFIQLDINMCLDKKIDHLLSIINNVMVN
jgi:hypothetical protein